MFNDNRKRYNNLLSESSITVLSSNITYNSSSDADFDFVVDRNFYYLTGINQEKVILVIIKNNNQILEYLFIEENDPTLVKWVGKKLEKDQAKEISKIENIMYLSEFEEFINKESKKNYQNIYLNLKKNKNSFYNYNYDFSLSILDKFNLKNVINNYQIIVDLRFVKSEDEINLIKDSIDITNVGILEMMKQSRSGIYEYQLENYFNFTLLNSKQRKTSFTTICASGKNATTLHYIQNNSLLKDNELVLIDLGAQTSFYISDISRTFPVNGVFTKRQKEVYNEVLNVNKKCIEFAKVGLTMKELNEYAKKLLTDACYRLNLIKEDEEVNKYYYHSIGHSIGLDTHDPMHSSYTLLENSCITIEPGLYIEEEGIGVRIEDNILIKSSGNVNLSEKIIKEVEDIENFFKQKKA